MHACCCRRAHSVQLLHHSIHLAHNTHKHTHTNTHTRTHTHTSQRDLLEVLYRCSLRGRPELHARFMPTPDVSAVFDELREMDTKVRMR